MNWLRTLERKVSRYTINNLMNYIVAGQVLVFGIMFLIDASFYYNIILWRSEILRGEVWRLITFVFAPTSTQVLWFAISAYFYYIIGKTLEYTWGTTRFNLYFLFGMLGAIAAGMLTGYADNSTLLLSLFFAFAMLYPEREVLVFFVLPVKMKWLGWLSGALWAWSFLTASWVGRVGLVFSMAGFFIYFGKDFYDGIRARVRRELWRRKNRNNWR